MRVDADASVMTAWLLMLVFMRVDADASVMTAWLGQILQNEPCQQCKKASQVR